MKLSLHFEIDKIDFKKEEKVFDPTGYTARSPQIRVNYPRVMCASMASLDLHISGSKNKAP